jgi:hypothetical protein
LLRVQSKKVSIDASTGGSFFGSTGTRYLLYANSLMTATGATVTGNVDIEISEYLEKGDMIFSKMLPISNGSALISGGEVNVVATQNGKPLFLKPYNRVYINIPTKGTPPTGMQLFTGQPTVDSSISKVNWILPVRDSSFYQIGVFVTSGIDTLHVISDSLKLINCDKFMGSANLQNFTVSFTANGASLTASADFRGYTLIDGAKQIMAMYFSGDKYTEKYVPSIPVHFAAFTIINGKFYGGILGATPTTGNNYTVNLTQQDASTFKAQLNGL